MNAKDEAVRLLAALLYGYFGPVSFRVSPKREVVEARAERFDELPPFFQDRHLEVAADLVERLEGRRDYVEVVCPECKRPRPVAKVTAMARKFTK
ncbi:MAG TPA: hypothetical protein P5568_11370 [Acidobacteriota bacterium]|nr:hypothetical protein [Acidobacteriota bacterium]